MNLTYDTIARRIDHALLLPTLTPSDIDGGCRMAAAYGVASVCVKPSAVEQAASLLAGTDVRVGTVIGFPHGGQATVVKVFEARTAIEDGAIELDMVVNIGWVRGGSWQEVRGEIRSVVEMAHRAQALVKVIFEKLLSR